MMAFPLHPSSRRVGLLHWLALLLVAFSSCAWAQGGMQEQGEWPGLQLSIERLEVEGWAAHQFYFELEDSGAFRSGFEQLYEPASGGNYPGVDFSGGLQRLHVNDSGWLVEGHVAFRGLEGQLQASQSSDHLQVVLQLGQQALSNLAPFEPLDKAADWLQGGDFAALLELDIPADEAIRATLGVELSGLNFDSPDGRFAGAGLAAQWQADWSSAQQRTLRTTTSLKGGELLIDRFYTDFTAAPMQIRIDPAWDVQSEALAVIFELEDGGALTLKGRIEALKPVDFSSWNVYFDTLELAFPGAYQRYLETMAGAWALDGLQLTGYMAWSGAVEQGKLRSGALRISDLTAVDTQRGRFALTGLNTRIDPALAGGSTLLDWSGLLFGQVALGSGQARLALGPEAITLLDPLTLTVLGGELRLQELRYPLPGSDAAAFLKAGLHELELEPLTRFLGWPQFSGRISGDLPGASLEEGVLSVDGAIRIEVFGGDVTIGDLGIERPFGVLPSVAANVELNDLDLALLTETFSFGRIGGRVDGYVRDLRLLDWSPVAFDAWLGTPQRQQGKQQISRQAVKHLADIGGGGATAALANPFLKMFNNFSYRRLGLGCRLDNHVCEVRGVKGGTDDGGGVVLLEGAGLPRVNINAYNRYIDWPQMVSNLAAVSAGGEIEVGGKPRP